MTQHPVVLRSALFGSRVFQLVPAAVLDIVVEYTQYVIVQGELLCSFEIEKDVFIIPHQYVGDEHLTRGDPERGIITQKFRDINTLYTFYSLTGKKMRQITTNRKSPELTLLQMIPDNDDEEDMDDIDDWGNSDGDDIVRNSDNKDHINRDDIVRDRTFFNSDFCIVWGPNENHIIFDSALFGETRKPFTHWIDEDDNIIHHVGGGGGGDDGAGRSYPLQLPSWVSSVLYGYIRVTNEFIFLLCEMQDESSIYSGLPSSPDSTFSSTSSSTSRLCLFTLEGHFIKFLTEVETNSVEDFIVTKDQQIVMLMVNNSPERGSYQLAMYTSSGKLCKTIDIAGYYSHVGDPSLSLLKSGHLAVTLCKNYVGIRGLDIKIII